MEIRDGVADPFLGSGKPPSSDPMDAQASVPPPEPKAPVRDGVVDPFLAPPRTDPVPIDNPNPALAAQANPNPPPVGPLGNSMDQYKADAATTEADYPGFMQTFGSAAKRKALESATNLALGAQVVLPEGLGGQTLKQAYENETLHPKTKDKIDNLLNETISQGWSDWRWWTAQLGATAGGFAPGLATAGAATMVGGPLAGIAGFAGEAALEGLVPNYTAARAAGKDHDTALKQAIIDSGIAATFASAMGLVGKIPVGQVLGRATSEQVANLLEKPISEAFLQLSVVQPGLMGGQELATSMANHEDVNADHLLTTMVIGGIGGYGVHRAFKALDAIKGVKEGEPGIPATEETIARAAAAQAEAAIRKAGGTPEPAAPNAPPGAPGTDTTAEGASDVTRQALGLPPAGERPPGPGEGLISYEQDIAPRPVFYSQLGRVLEEKMPARASARQVLDIINGSGITEEQRARAPWIPSYLEDQNGAIDKQELLAHVAANMIQIKEVHASQESELLHEKRDAVEAQANMLYGEDWTKWPKDVYADYQALHAEFKAARAKEGPLNYEQAYNWLPGDEGIQKGRRELVMYTGDPLDAAAQKWAADNGITWEKADSKTKGNIYRAVQEEAKKSGRPIEHAYSDYHWPGLHNVFLHVRAQERRGPEGQRGLVLTEVQSTAHQAARREGYIGEQTRDPDAISKDLYRVREDIHKLMRKKDISTEKDQKWISEDLKKLEGEHQALRNELYKAGKTDEDRSVPMSLPFKTDWQELAIKRMARWAVDHGYDELIIPSGDMVALRLDNAKQAAGARQSYDKVLPKEMRKLAKQVGTTVESRLLGDITPEEGAKLFIDSSQAPGERLRRYKEMGLIGGDKPFNQYVTVMKLTPASSGIIREGLAMDRPLQAKGGRTLSDLVETNALPKALAPHAKKIGLFLQRLGSEFGISRRISFNAVPMDGVDWRGRLRGVDPLTGNYMVDINTLRILTPHDLYAAASHEFGHVIMEDMFETAKASDQAPIFKAFQARRMGLQDDALVGDIRRLRDNAISLMTGARAMHDGLRLSDLDPGSKAYFLSFEEYFAEQVAKYLQTDAKPLGVADTFFKRLANKIKKMLSVFQKSDPQAGRPDQAIQEFLDARWGMPNTWPEAIKEQFDRDTTKAAQSEFERAGAPETKAVPEQPSTGGGRGILAKLGLGGSGGREMAAHGDRMNWFYDLMLSLPQVQQLNRHLKQLGYYLEMHRTADQQMKDMMQEAHQRITQWGMIRDPKMLESLSKFINDYANGMFKLPHTEDGIFRRPNPEEFAALIKKHGLSDQAVKLFDGVRQDFDTFLEKYRRLLINDAYRIKDPVQRDINIQNINVTIGKLLKRPFFPLTRFGKYLVTVYDARGKIRHSEQTSSLKRQRQIVEALSKHPDRLPGDIVLPSEVPKDATPFLGMPPGLIDLMANKLTLSLDQRRVLDQLRFDYAPGQSFKHQFRELDLLPGYSTDFMRNYAHFFFHGARHVTRVTWSDAMRDQINSLGSDEMRMSRAGNKDGANKLDKIIKYMQKHFEAWADPKSDWGTLRGIAFHWYLGFNPASAVTNLTQTPLMTLPYLSAAYGDFAAAKHILKASTDLNNFYKKGTLLSKGAVLDNTPENFMDRALAEMVKRGTISETQAHMLAAVSEDRNLLRPFGKKGEAFWLKFQESSSWMFEMTEQYNRRVAARAALELGYKNPNSKEVKESIADSPMLYNELTNQLRWTPQEAGAFLAAQRAVARTQFEYAQYARPRAFRGPIGGSLFVFKLFAQNTLFNLMSNPAMFARWMLTMGALGGLQGLVGFENANSLIKAIAWQLFGKDFDLEDEARQLVKNFTDETWAPDIVMHGLSAKGFGIPAVMHSVGVTKFPTVDLSKSVGFGDVLGFDPFRPLSPTKNPKEEELRQISRSVGAVFGLPISIYDFAAAGNYTELKKYEALMPRFLGNLSHAYRWAAQGKETNAAGNAVVRFNPYDTEQMSEILLRAGGFQPRRLTEEWGRITAVRDNATVFDLRRQILLRQFGDAVKNSDPDGKSKTLDAIRQFNRQLPDFAKSKSITGAQLTSSVQQRMRVQALQEQGLPAQKSNIPIAREIEKYYPRGWPKDLQDARPVK